MTTAVMAACIVISATDSSAADSAQAPLDLKPSYVAGDKTVVTYQYDLHASVAFEADGGAEPGATPGTPVRLSEQAEFDVEHLVDGPYDPKGGIGQVRLSYKKAVIEHEEGSGTPLPWQGKRLTLPDEARARFGLERSIAESRRLAWQSGRLQAVQLLKGGPVAVGESWAVERTDLLRALLRLPEDSSVSCKATFGSISVVDGHRSAVIGLAAAATVPMEGASLSYALTGRACFSTDVGKMIRIELAGAVRPTGRPADPSLADRIAGEGEVRASLRFGWKAPARIVDVPPPPDMPGPSGQGITDPTPEQVTGLEDQWKKMVAYLLESPGSHENRGRFAQAYLDLAPTPADLVLLFGTEAAKRFESTTLKQAFATRFIQRVRLMIEDSKLTRVEVKPDDETAFQGGTFLQPVKTYAVYLRPTTGKGVIFRKFAYVNGRWVLLGL